MPYLIDEKVWEVYLLALFPFCYYCFYTTNTAQGGGVAEVSKNGQPTEEVGCCESWMAERTH